MSLFNIFIVLIILIKVLFIGMSAIHIYLKLTHNEGSYLDNIIVYWKEREEFIFIVLMAILLILIFNPRYPNMNFLTNESKILLFLFGIILLVTAKWGTFFEESKWFRELQYVLRG